MKNNIKEIYSNDHSLVQYYNEAWKCEIDNEIPMTLVVEVTDMYEATGEEEFKDYPVAMNIGMLNKNIHESINCDLEEDETRYIDDILCYYGMNCYLDSIIYNMDTINKNLRSELSISKATIASYENRFTGEQQEYLKFKTENDAFEFAEKLVMEYGNTIMSLIGFYLDRPINLIGDTAWSQTELFDQGEK